MTELTVTVDGFELAATWLDRDPAVREAVEAALPIRVDARRWGEELYGTVAIDVAPTHTTTQVDPGTLAFWPDGPAVCLFWGPTPASTDETPVAASPVAPFATLETVDPLRAVEGGAALVLTRPDDTG